MKTYISKIIGSFFFAMLLLSCSGDESFSPDLGSVGTGGSLARFAAWGNFLYTVDNTSLKVFNLNNPDNPNLVNTVDLGLGIETIFPFEGYLFVGSQTGMYIISLENPTAPQLLSTYQHITSCDPVVARGNYAYVTLRSEAFCWGVNELHVLDISDLENPVNKRILQMENPFGLGVGSYDRLFVCEGEFGLKIFDIEDPEDPKLINIFEDIHAYDVIARHNHLIMTGNDGIFQYGYDADTIFQLSVIPVLEIND